MIIDIRFRVSGDTVPRNNAYYLFAGICKSLGQDHLPKEIGVFSIGGNLVGKNITLTERSAVTFRVPHTMLGHIAVLTGRQIEVGNHFVRLGPSFMTEAIRSPTMYASTVFFNNSTTAENFAQQANYELKKMGIAGTATVPMIQAERRQDQPEKPMSRIVEVKGCKLPAFSLLVEGLSPEHSQRLIEEGLGGKRHFGCGLFVPVSPK